MFLRQLERPSYGSPHYSLKELRQCQEDTLHQLLQQGDFKPLFLYHIALIICLPLLGLATPRHGRTRYVRSSVFALILGLSVDILLRRRTVIGGNGYIIGIFTTWWLLWSATLLVFTDVEHDFQRIERVVVETRVILRWQSYPSSLLHQIDWCFGLFVSLRGLEWNWRSPHMGPIPRSVHAQLQSGFISNRIQSVDDVIFDKKRDLRQEVFAFIGIYFLIDILKVWVILDPYFEGKVSSMDAVPPFSHSFISNVPIFSPFFYSFFTAFCIYCGFNALASLYKIFSLGLSITFPSWVSKFTSVPLDEPWLYEVPYGPVDFNLAFMSNGILHFWGRWWQQYFRYVFTATARWVVSCLPNNWKEDMRIKSLIYALVVFSTSGFLHAAGSYTQLADTHHLSGPFLFFCLQALGVIVEVIVKTTIFPKLTLAVIPYWLRRAIIVLYMSIWLAITGPFLMDDFFRGGMATVEPLPFSPIRALGLINDTEWFHWV